MFKRKRQPKLKDQIAGLETAVKVYKEQIDTLQTTVKFYKDRAGAAETRLNEFVASESFLRFQEVEDQIRRNQAEESERFEARKKKWEKTRAEFEEELKKQKDRATQSPQYGFTSEETDAGIKFHFSGRDPFRKAWSSRQQRKASQGAYRPTSSPFGILGLYPNATKTQIKAKYRELAKKWHPDKPGGDEAKFNEITQAYKDCLKMAV